MTSNPNGDELHIRRKWTLRAHGRRLVLEKRIQERTEHVLMKAFLWALYLPDYPDLLVEYRIGDRFRPDVIALGADGSPTFWGEAGQVKLDKIRSILRRHAGLHLVIAKWNIHAPLYRRELEKTLKQAPGYRRVDFINFPEHARDYIVENRIEIPEDELRAARRVYTPEKRPLD